jgi:hypothetical protein
MTPADPAQLLVLLLLLLRMPDALLNGWILL